MPKQLPSFLSNESLEFILFGGKGGTGKTTCAAATALQWAKRGSKTLVFSTDPAHSLSDSFDVQIGNKITPIAENLEALEMNSEELHKDFRKTHGEGWIKIAVRGTFFDRDDLSGLADLDLPGMDEMMAIIKLEDLIKEDKYGTFILDTAPTGHTLRLLDMPNLLEGWIRVLNVMEAKYKYVKETFGRYKKDEAAKFLDTLRSDTRRIISILRNPDKTEFVPVTIPEAMGVEETRDLLGALDVNKLTVRNLVINRVIPSAECKFCASRKTEQEKYVEQIKSLVQKSLVAPEKYNVVEMPLFPHEIRGIDGLIGYGKILAGEPYEYKPTKPPKAGEAPRKAKAPRMRDLLEKKRRLIIFGGKGGVGKTTAAAATALYIAKKMPDKKVLVFSTDPAHSLADSFDMQIGGEIKQIRGVDNLYAIEINADAEFKDFKEKYLQGEIRKIHRELTPGNVRLPFEEELMDRMEETKPPGLDEIMVLTKLVEITDSEEYDFIILDTAPTGHTLRLLELPDKALEWVDRIIKMLWRYRILFQMVKSLEQLLIKKRQLKRLIPYLQSSKTEFVAATIPEVMAIAETERLIEGLRKIKIPIGHILINGVIPPTKCGFCASMRKEQEEYIKEINRRFPDYTVAEMQLFPHEVRGIDGLTEYAEFMYGG